MNSPAIPEGFPNMEKQPIDGNGYRGPAFFNRDENVVMMKMKWLAQPYQE